MKGMVDSLPRCPDCGGDLAARKCMGLPIYGRPTRPLLDARVPLPDDSRNIFPSGSVGDQARALFRERAMRTGPQVDEIDRELIAILYLWIPLSYYGAGGCGHIEMINPQSKVES